MLARANTAQLNSAQTRLSSALKLGQRNEPLTMPISRTQKAHKIIVVASKALHSLARSHTKPKSGLIMRSNEQIS